MCTTLTPFIYWKLRVSIKEGHTPKSHHKMLGISQIRTLIWFKNSLENAIRLRIFPVFNNIFPAECGRRGRALPPMHRVFPTIGKFAPPPLPKKFPPVDSSAPPNINPPTKQQFSSYNPIKTEFLAVVIVLAPFLF